MCDFIVFPLGLNLQVNYIDSMLILPLRHINALVIKTDSAQGSNEEFRR